MIPLEVIQSADKSSHHDDHTPAKQGVANDFEPGSNLDPDGIADGYNWSFGWRTALTAGCKRESKGEPCEWNKKPLPVRETASGSQQGLARVWDVSVEVIHLFV
jgi:hypothetical protein